MVFPEQKRSPCFGVATDARPVTTPKVWNSNESWRGIAALQQLRLARPGSSHIDQHQAGLCSNVCRGARRLIHVQVEPDTAAGLDARAPVPKACEIIEHETCSFVIASSAPGFARPAPMKRAVCTSPAGRGRIILAIRVRGFASSTSPFGRGEEPAAPSSKQNQSFSPFFRFFFLALLGEAIQLGAAPEAGWLRREGLLAMTGLRLQVFSEKCLFRKVLWQIDRTRI